MTSIKITLINNTILFLNRQILILNSYSANKFMKKKEKDEEPLIVEEELSKYEKFRLSLSMLKQSERSLFLIFFLNFLMSFQFYILSTLVPLYFTDEHDLSDLLSGVIFGVFGVSIGLTSIIIGKYSSLFSLKTGLFLSSIWGFSGFVMLLFNQLYLSIVAVVTFEAVSCAISWQFIEQGINAYSTIEVRAYSTSILYMFNYLAGILAGLFIDVIYDRLEYKVSLYIVLFGTAGGTCLLSFLLIFCLRNIRQQWEIRKSGEIENKKKFIKYCCLIALLILLRSACFGHLDTTFPKYLTRVMDDDSAHFGSLLAVHSVTIMSVIFFSTIFLYYYTSYTLIATGALIGSMSSAILIAWEAYPAFYLTVIGISIGEALWVPRLLDYTYQIAPRNQENIYLALCNCPFYFGMILTGISSGLLLEEYCPDDGEKHCYVIWVVISSSSVFISLMIFTFRKLLEDKEHL